MSAKGENPTEKHRSSRIAGGLRRVDNPNQKKWLVTKSEE
jgi:hypothetical protein